jgi:Sulfotransferase domain
MVPTFLGIAAPKAGTTWLHELLAGHPQVRMPALRKEVHYFDLHFDRGQDWYERFFAGPDDAAPVAVGEITPHYLYDPAVPARVRSMPSVDRFVLILRNPVDRAFSHYRFRRRQDGTDETFEAFLEREPNAVEWGRYGAHLAPWLEEFGRDRFLVLVHERAVADVGATQAELAAHLGIDPARWPPGGGTDRVNESFAPRRGRLYAGAVRGARWLRRHDLDRVIGTAKRAGAVRALKRPAPGPADGETMAPATAARLWAELGPDVDRLAALTGLDLAVWREAATVPAGGTDGG